MTIKRGILGSVFKRETAKPVFDQSYSIPQACEALGVGETAYDVGFIHSLSNGIVEQLIKKFSGQ